MITRSTIHSRRYAHERESQEREDRQEVLDRPDELPRLHPEARPVGRQHGMSRRGAERKMCLPTGPNQAVINTTVKDIKDANEETF